MGQSRRLPRNRFMERTSNMQPAMIGTGFLQGNLSEYLGFGMSDDESNELADLLIGVLSETYPDAISTIQWQHGQGSLPTPLRTVAWTSDGDEVDEDTLRSVEHVIDSAMTEYLDGLAEQR